MQKIRCPRCGVVNLEKFVTFPQCVGCGSTLPTLPVASTPFWRRPLGAFLWVSVLGIALVVLVIGTSFLSTPLDSEAQLIVYGSAPRRVALRQTIIVGMTIDAVKENRLQERAPLQNIKVRIPRALFDKFAFVSLDPTPDTVSTTAGGRYFHYNSLPRQTALKLRLYARSPGQYRSRIAVYSDEHLPGFCGLSVLVARPQS